MKIGEFLRLARKEKNITLRQLSDLTHISFSQLGKIEREEHKPTRENSLKIAEALQIDQTILFKLLGYQHENIEKSHSVDPLLRYKVLVRDRFKCKVCGEGPPKVSLEVDLILPKANGGEIKPDNLVCLCDQCLRGRTLFIANEGLEKDLLFAKNKIRTTL
ncbi:helix-turn-helix domain-containing protein [Cytobacillus firmus]